ncbi:MAG: hypothetical protein Q9N34_01445 [Aquificota bacterium]|nr:hypothetical protein [Aquificota bacterium]
MENVKVFSAEDKLLESFKCFNEKIYRSLVKSELYITGNTAINYIFGYSCGCGVLSLRRLQNTSGTHDARSFISCLTALFMVQPPYSTVQKALMKLRGSLPVVARVENTEHGGGEGRRA